VEVALLAVLDCEALLVITLYLVASPQPAAVGVVAVTIPFSESAQLAARAAVAR
jgi:hypothetical protein